MRLGAFVRPVAGVEDSNVTGNITQQLLQRRMLVPYLQTARGQMEVGPPFVPNHLKHRMAGGRGQRRAQRHRRCLDHPHIRGHLLEQAGALNGRTAPGSGELHEQAVEGQGREHRRDDCQRNARPEGIARDYSRD
ncbi:hypothetical protein D9M71_759050 [compost metagenome]